MHQPGPGAEDGLRGEERGDADALGAGHEQDDDGEGVEQGAGDDEGARPGGLALADGERGQDGGDGGGEAEGLGYLARAVDGEVEGYQEVGVEVGHDCDVEDHEIEEP